jgi:hypothetical protein
MHAAHEQSYLIDGILLTIIIAYLGIAWQFYTRRRSTPGGRATAALNQLVIIFVFCAFCGYLPRIVPVPELPLVIAHVVLAGAAWAYLLSRQVDRLSLAVDFADAENAPAARHAREVQDESLDAEAEACARLAETIGSKVVAAEIRARVAARQARRQSAVSAIPASA